MVADPGFIGFEPARFAMGDTRRFAERMRLAEAQPRGELGSTGYALACPGNEYLVLQPDATGEPFTVTPAAGVHATQWYGIGSRPTVATDETAVDNTTATTLRAPADLAGPAVAYLRNVGLPDDVHRRPVRPAES